MALRAARLAALILTAALPHAAPFASATLPALSSLRASLSPRNGGLQNALVASASRCDSDAPFAVVSGVLLAVGKQVKEWGRGVSYINKANSAVVPGGAATMCRNLIDSDSQTPVMPAVVASASRNDAASVSTDTASAGLKRAAMHTSSVACSAYFENLRADGRVEHCGLLR